jgi:hypothetical protein
MRSGARLREVEENRPEPGPAAGRQARDHPRKTSPDSVSAGLPGIGIFTASEGAAAGD